MDSVKVIDTPYNNAVAIFNRANEILNENGVLDSSGTEIAQLEMTPGNPAWIFALACGNLHTSWQQQLSKAYAALDPQSCDEDQVLVLASLAGINRGNGTPSHITVRITNTSSETLSVAVGTIFKESVTNNNWAINKTLNLAPAGEVGDSAISTLYSSEDGLFDVPETTVFNNPDGLSVKCEAISNSSGGSEIETIASLRNRITQGNESVDPRIKAMNAISRLSGIESCSIWFNNSIGDMVIGNKNIPGRNAYISVKGVDITEKLAEVYYTYMNCPASIGEHESRCMIGQQEVSVNFDYAEEKVVDIYVTISSVDSKVGASDVITSKISEHSGTLNCGQNLTAQMVSEWISNLGYGTIIGCNVGNESGLVTDIEPDEYCVFNKDSIHVSRY